MYDRSVQYSDYYQIKKVAGTDDIFQLIPAPGLVYQEGTKINKASLLKDETAALFGVGEDGVPDDVLQYIHKDLLVLKAAPLVEFGSYVGAGTVGEDAPNILSFGFDPEILIVWSNLSGISGMDAFSPGIITFRRTSPYNDKTALLIESGQNRATFRYCYFNWGEKSVSWFYDSPTSYSADIATQLNLANTTYFYFAAKRRG